MSDGAWAVLVDTMTTDEDATVRAGLWGLLKEPRHKNQPRLDEAGAIADDLARYARSGTPPDLTALAGLHRLALADLLPELASHDLEQPRRAAYLLARREFRQENLSQGLLDEVVGGLLGEPDAFLRSSGVAMVRWFGLAQLHPLLRELQETETDPWVQFYLKWCLAERPTSAWDDFANPTAQEYIDQPPF